MEKQQCEIYQQFVNALSSEQLAKFEQILKTGQKNPLYETDSEYRILLSSLRYPIIREREKMEKNKSCQGGVPEIYYLIKRSKNPFNF